MMRTKVVLKSGKDQSLKRFHPWVFSGAIKKIYGEPNEGDILDVYSNKDEFLGRGHYQIGSIAVRILTFIDEEINQSFWDTKIETALQYRKMIGLLDNTSAFRLIHAEGDNLPGLIVDYYNGTIVLQMHSIGMFLAKELIIETIKAKFDKPINAIYNKSETTLPFKSEQKAKNEYLLKPLKENTEVLENGLKFNIDWVKGQKTGFFIDQRDNRNLLMSYANSKNVLNMFGYTGGFSVYAMAGGANLVHTVDSSDRAIHLANQNIELNFNKCNKHKGFSVDAFNFLNTPEEKYDLIILDPPAFAKHHNVLPNALQGYKRLNQKALEIIEPGGIIFTFTCSQVVSKENFKKSIFVAAANANRKVKIMHYLSQPLDHPINIYHPESEYLKGLVLYVE